MATFGKLTNGASNTLHNANRKVLSKATLTEDAVLTSLTIRVRTNNTTEDKVWKGVIYSDTAGAPGTLIATTAEGSIVGTTVVSYTAHFAGEHLAAGDYWIGFIHDGNTTTAVHPYRDNTASMAVSNTDAYADGPTTTYGAVAYLNGPIDAYVTYTPDTDPALLASTLSPQTLALSIPSPTNAVPGVWSAKIQAWVYPGYPAEHANSEYADGRVIHTLKPEYYHVNTDGTLLRMTEALSGANGYTAANALDVIAHSTEQYFTVSADGAAMAALTGDPTNYSNAISTLTSFCSTTGFTGVELDWEGFGAWTSTSYANYKLFVEDLATSLHGIGKKLIIIGPPIGNTTEQGYYKWKYEDFETSLADFIAVMAYDYQFDYGGGTAVAPNTWVEHICTWVMGKLSDVDRIVMGMPSYGYMATVGGWDIEQLTKEQAATKPGYVGATLDPDSNEMKWTNGGKYYSYVDVAGMDAKRTLIENKGITRVSVWHLGGNDWFTSLNSEPGESAVGTTATANTVTVSTPAMSSALVGSVQTVSSANTLSIVAPEMDSQLVGVVGTVLLPNSVALEMPGLVLEQSTMLSSTLAPCAVSAATASLQNDLVGSVDTHASPLSVAVTMQMTTSGGVTTIASVQNVVITIPDAHPTVVGSVVNQTTQSLAVTTPSFISVIQVAGGTVLTPLDTQLLLPEMTSATEGAISTEMGLLTQPVQLQSFLVDHFVFLASLLLPLQSTVSVPGMASSITTHKTSVLPPITEDLVPPDMVSCLSVVGGSTLIPFSVMVDIPTAMSTTEERIISSIAPVAFSIANPEMRSYATLRSTTSPVVVSLMTVDLKPNSSSPYGKALFRKKSSLFTERGKIF